MAAVPLALRSPGERSDPGDRSALIEGPGFRGVYHRARIRATRWLMPGYGAALLRLEAGGADHLAPFFGFLRDQPAELGR
jgi:hypothetical protein